MPAVLGDVGEGFAFRHVVADALMRCGHLVPCPAIALGLIVGGTGWGGEGRIGWDWADMAILLGPRVARCLGDGSRRPAAAGGHNRPLTTR
jgi:hypothetical protein